MSILTFPTLKRTFISSSMFSLMPNTQIFESTLNRTVQTMELPGARWLFSYTFENLEYEDIKKLKVFIAQLRGMSGRFYMNDKTYTKTGTASDTGLVKGANQTGNTLLTYGWDTSQSTLFAAGDYFTVNGELKLITEDISSDESGVATLVFEPPLRYSPPDNAGLTITNPAAIFRLSDDKADNFNINPPYNSDFTINGVEVFS